MSVAKSYYALNLLKFVAISEKKLFIIFNFHEHDFSVWCFAHQWNVTSKRLKIKMVCWFLLNINLHIN